MTAIKILAIALLAALSGGCTLFNPYESEFNCPPTFMGKCVSVKAAYEESMQPDKPPIKKKENPKSVVREKTEPTDATELEEIPEARTYRAALYDRMATMLREPTTPLVAPPKAMRVYFLPYRGADNELYLQHYSYFFVDGPQWVLGETVAPEGDE